MELNFFMFKWIIEQNKAVTTTFCLLNKKEMCLSETDLSEMKQAITFLQPFQAATQEMSARGHLCLFV